MARISEAYPSKYLSAADLQDRNLTVKMDNVQMEEIGDGRKPVVYFVGKEKGLALNKTNANTISAAYGDDTDDWRDGDIILYPTMVDYQGRSTPAIRVRIPPRRPAQAGSAMPPPKAASTALRGDLDDDIPF